MRPEKAAAGGVSSRLNMESARLLYDNGNAALCRGGAWKTEESRWVDGWTATGLDAVSRMRQGGRGPGRLCWMDMAREVKKLQFASPLCSPE